MAAVVTELPARELSLETVAEPMVGPRDLLLRVQACGICGTDLHILEGASYRPELPFVLGHEPVGTVVAAGSEAGDDWTGRRTTLTLFEGCGSCAWCAHGLERLCPDLRSVSGVFATWGGFAELMVIPVAQAVAVPEALTSASAATLVDAGATAMNAAAVIGEARRNRVLIAGGGPVGFLLAEILRHRGVRVTVSEPQERRRAALAKLGHDVVAGLGDIASGVDVLADCAGAEGVVGQAFELLPPRGLLVAVGYGRLSDLDFAPVARKELTIRGIRSGSHTDLADVLRLAAAGDIRLPAISTWPIAEINDAFAALRRGEVEGKAVILVQENE
jgi:2-desacetyl-2-hydroxyethyl bacteriochlorophyllide A dehydrogenase